MEERNSREDLSALMDGELGAETARFLLRRIEGDPGLARDWSRWHLIRACLAQRSPSSLHSDPLRIVVPSGDDAFAARVMDAVRVQPRRHWVRYLGGGAIAASVAAAALMLSVPQSTSTDGMVAAGSGQHSTRAPAAAIPATALAPRLAAAPAGRTTPTPWLDRQPTFLAARPTVAGSVSGDYLQQAAYAPDSTGISAPMLMREPRQNLDGAPYMILLMPDQSAQRAQAQLPRQH